MEQSNDFALKRIVDPYVGYFIIFTAISFIWSFAIYRTGNWGGIGVLALLWGVLLVSQYPNTRYRIFWHDDEIEQVSAYKDVTIIKVAEVKRVALESSDLRTLLSLTRPSNRITIYGKEGERPQWIDISLKHFAAEDIRRLMRAIRERRPEISIPKEWL